MPTPSSTAVPRQDLTDALMEYSLSQDRFIGLNLFPIFPTREKAAHYPIIPRGAFLKLPPNIQRAARANYGRGDWQFDDGSFDCAEHGWEELVDDTEARLYAAQFNAEQVAGERCVGVIRRAQEKRILDLCLAVAATGAIVNEWNDSDAATPLDDVKVATRLMWETKGVRPDTLVLGFRAFQALGSCDQIINRIRNVSTDVMRGNLSEAMLANAFELRQVLVSDVIYDAAGEGIAFSGAPLWDKDKVLLCKVAANASDLREPCIGRTFLWTADSPDNVMTEVYRAETNRSDVVRVRQYTAEKVVMADAGYVLTNAIDDAITTL